MGTKFTALQRTIFNAQDGAYSPITSKDEATKGQITLTGHETELVENWFGKHTIYTGKASKSPNAVKTFHVWNKNGVANLKLVYPKPEKTELRLYMNKGQGFRPLAGDVWFVYTPANRSAGMISIGWMNPYDWETLGSTDEDDEDYLIQVAHTLPNQPVPAAARTTTTSSGYRRDRVIAQTKLALADYKCEADPSHLTFLSPLTQRMFMEPHHLVPMKAQEDFEYSLDVVSNIISLCPTCHRSIHLGERCHKKSLLEKFYPAYQANMKSSGIELDLDVLLAYYNL